MENNSKGMDALLQDIDMSAGAVNIVGSGPAAAVQINSSESLDDRLANLTAADHPLINRGAHSLAHHKAFDPDSIRMERATPDYRLAVMPNNSMVLQRAFTWTQGNTGGVEWRNQPVVRLDVDGKEVKTNAPGAKNE